MNFLIFIFLALLIFYLLFPILSNIFKDFMCLYAKKFICPKKGHLIEKEGNFCSHCGEYPDNLN